MKTSLLRFLLIPLLMLSGMSAVFAKTNPLPALQPLDWSVWMAKSQMGRAGKKLNGPPKQKGRWDYTTGMYADALIRLSATTDNPVYEKSAQSIIGSFIGPTGKIATYQGKHDNSKRKVKAKAKGSPAPKPGPAKAGAKTGAKPSPTPKPGPKRAKPKGKPKGKAKPSPTPKPQIPYSLDEVQSGVATLKLYDLTGEARYLKAAKILRNQLRKHPRNREGGFWHKFYLPNQMWLDGLYMAEPFYADYAAYFDEPKDFKDITKQFTLVGEHTYDSRTGLFYHGWDESKKQPWANRKTGASPHFWSRAIGWYAMALADVLEKMPKDDPNRPQLVDWFNKCTAGILKYQDPKAGVWWQVTDKRGYWGNYRESTASCMFVYALAKGVNEGVLPRSDIPAIRAGYQGVIRQFVTLDNDGKSIDLTRCCQVAGLDAKHKGSYRYYTHVPPIVSNDLKGVAPFINAGVECQKLFGGTKFGPKTKFRP